MKYNMPLLTGFSCTASAALAGCLIFLFCPASCPGASGKPNVLFIAIDDQNDWVGCLGGNPDTRTPNIDRLASRGMVFANAECAAPSCIPSRCALMTGVRPADSGIYCNMNGHFRDYPELRDRVTLPQYFARQGYHTMGVGKILHHPDKADYNELCPIVYWQNPLPPGIPDNNRRNVQEYLDDWLPLDVDVTEMTDWKMAHWAVERLKRKHDKPFLLACGFFRPHEPWHVPRKYYDKFPLDKLTLPKVKKDDLDDLGPGQRKPNPTIVKIVGDETTWRKGVQAYLASINFADECVGLLLDALNASPYRDNTIVMLWSDHGFHLGEKYHWSKFTLWERSARCVLVCAGPGVTPATRCNQPVNLIDMYPTLLEMCGLPPRADQAGVTFLPLFKDPTKHRDPSITANEKGFTVRTQRWRYIAYHDGAEELYDHDKDPNEWDNLAGKAEFAETKKTLRAFMPKDPLPGRKPDSEPKAKSPKGKAKGKEVAETDIYTAIP
jgi:arylsulfatase A-like enzyme